ncbi:MAG: hypothetical protein QM809_02215 [Gordonia sp. (in: high G+C Gram-positive bacteria)]|uniref:hypothetical protein n=1 Tax=Gordonia sp. (in: high G+C Gram-positive bacteria) TaxID=84139 RepID=UPI0039E35C5D
MRSTMARILVATVAVSAAALGSTAVPSVANAGTVDYHRPPTPRQGGKVAISSAGQNISVVITGRRDALTGSRTCEVSLGNQPARRVKLDRNGNGRTTFGRLRNGRYSIWGYCSSKTQRAPMSSPRERQSYLIGANRQGGYAVGVIVNGRPAGR